MPAQFLSVGSYQISEVVAVGAEADLLGRVDERTKLILDQLREIKESVKGKADQADVDDLDKRVTDTERKVWYASGVTGTVAFVLSIIGKSMIGGSKP